MNNTNFQLLEQHDRLTPLGLRFWDSVNGTFVGSGLEVTAYPAVNPRQRVKAVANRSGIYLLQNLQGMRRIENQTGDSLFWTTPPQKPFVIEVRAESGLEFLPFQFSLDLPVKEIFRWACWPVASPLASPLEALPVGIPLFSSPARPVPAGLAAIYAELWNPKGEIPAAGALLEIRSTERPPAWGLADELGRVTLMIAYPEPLAFEPPAANQSGRALTEQVWPLELRAYYKPSAPATVLPDLCQSMNQPLTTLWANTGLTVALTRANLRYGQALQLSTQNEQKGRLLITPAAG